ncbi:transmembrane protein 230 isoform X1 [Rattus rattus]|uniref:transmembrane protein 230 isoform X1 n=1 Tax=Rattus rattus TaxID=10117 RepID=UPI0013F35A08|nr:transmembrane protein 230 isoform X1 [Rattus rattus]XP_032760152.1 transmembrane protein 230 isoform X1 [Rattus rattus]
MMPSRTNLATGIPSSKVKYSRLSSTDDGYIDLQFKKSPPKIPYKAIALATVLFLIGTFLIIIGSLLLSGYISKGVTDLGNQSSRRVLSLEGCEKGSFGRKVIFWMCCNSMSTQHPRRAVERREEAVEVLALCLEIGLGLIKVDMLESMFG